MNEQADTLVENGLAAHRRGLNNEALALYQQAIALSPSHARANMLVGIALSQLGRHEDALGYLRRGVELAPGDPKAHFNLGFTLAAAGRAQESLATLESCLGLDARYLPALNQKGIVLRTLGRVEEAVATHEQAATHSGGNPDALTNLSSSYRAAARYADAERVAREAVSKSPTAPAAQVNLAQALQAQNRLEEALTYCSAVLEKHPSHPQAEQVMVNLLVGVGRGEEAVQRCSRWPDPVKGAGDADAALNAGRAFMSCNRLDEALVRFDAALALRPGFPEARWNRGLALLTQGRFEEGWEHLEARWELPGYRSWRRTFAQPAWNGEDLANRTILVTAEQGVGDTFQFVRFARDLKARGATVLFECQSGTKRLLQRLPELAGVYEAGEPLPPFHCHLPVMSLPGRLHTGAATIPPPCSLPTSGPVTAPQLHPMQKERPRVGLVWAGNPSHRNDRNRSLHLEQLRSLVEVARVAWYSFQFGVARDQLRQAPWASQVVDLAGSLADFADTADVLKTMDLLITVDTSVAHLGGSIGIPTWVLLPFCPDWRWMLDREDSPWYPTVRLFRQPSTGNWKSVIDRVTSAMEGASFLRR